MITIRQFRPDDAEPVRRLFLSGQLDFARDVIRTDEDRKMFYGFLKDSLSQDLADIAGVYLQRPDSNFWICEQDEPIGCLGLYRHSAEEAEIRRVAVATSARRLGIGSLLMDQAEAFCRAAGYRTIMLWTANHLTAAISFYRRRNYRQIDEQPFGDTNFVFYQYALDL